MQVAAAEVASLARPPAAVRPVECSDLPTAPAQEVASLVLLSVVKVLLAAFSVQPFRLVQVAALLPEGVCSAPVRAVAPQQEECSVQLLVALMEAAFPVQQRSVAPPPVVDLEPVQP